MKPSSETYQWPDGTYLHVDRYILARRFGGQKPKSKKEYRKEKDAEQEFMNEMRKRGFVP